MPALVPQNVENVHRCVPQNMENVHRCVPQGVGYPLYSLGGGYSRSRVVIPVSLLGWVFRPTHGAHTAR